MRIIVGMKREMLGMVLAAILAWTRALPAQDPSFAGSNVEPTIQGLQPRAPAAARDDDCKLYSVR
ncbi:MAG: hypothetical protein VB877_15305 [Pirellulaceae bacterium]